MEIGSCHRRYQIPDFYREATEKFADRVRVDADGIWKATWPGSPSRRTESTRRLPTPGRSGPGTSSTATWARGRSGSSASSICPAASARPRPISATSSTSAPVIAPTSPPAATGSPRPTKSLWIAGGSFDEPFNARHLAWRQIRPEKADRKYKEADDTFVYVPTMRKPRRAATTWVDGIFTPRYTVSGDDGGGGFPLPWAFRGTARELRVDSPDRRPLDPGDRGHPARLHRSGDPSQRLRLAPGRRARGARAAQRDARWLPDPREPQLRPLRPLGGERSLGSALRGGDRGNRATLGGRGRRGGALDRLPDPAAPLHDHQARERPARSTWASWCIASAPTWAARIRSGPAASPPTSSTPWPPSSTTCRGRCRLAARVLRRPLGSRRSEAAAKDDLDQRADEGALARISHRVA